MSAPLVSVVTITYNHEPWIARTIEGVLAQEVDFPLEMVIAEDCSTDGTRAVCERYAEAHPDIIRLLPSERNLGIIPNERRAMAAARGKYIAFCEGDDYWTEPSKLQRQVDFLESHPDYSVCFTRCRHYNERTKEWSDDLCGPLFANGEEGVDVDVELFFNRWVTQPLTMVYRADAIGLDLYDRYKYYRDQHQIYHLLCAGKGYLFNFVSGVRVMHDGGLASLISTAEYCDISIPMDGEFYRKTRAKGAKETYLTTLQTAVGAYTPGRRFKALRCAFEHLLISGKIKRFVKNVVKIARG